MLKETNITTQEKSLDVRKLTNAPLKMHGEFHFNCTPEKLWPLISQASGIASWFPIILGGSHDNSTSHSKGACDVGAKRYCKTLGMGTLDETILYWDEPKLYAYNVKNFMMPIKNHVAIMSIEQTGPGKCKFIWQQYFDYKGFIMRHMFPHMMIFFMNWGLKNLRKRLGGAGGTMALVK